MLDRLRRMPPHIEAEIARLSRLIDEYVSGGLRTDDRRARARLLVESTRLAEERSRILLGWLRER